MVICNIVCDGLKRPELKKYVDCQAINTITDITDLHTGLPTLFYGYECAREHFPDLDRKNRTINEFYSWSYAEDEIPYENWVDEFVSSAGEKWFTFIDNGIDVVFDMFEVDAFCDHLFPYPLIQEGNYEVYIADFRDGDIIIHSIKKDTLEYVGIKVEDFLNEIYDRLEYRFISFEPKRFDLTSKSLPVFLDTALHANGDKWMGIPEIINHFNGSGVDIDRKKIIVYYLKQSKFLREKFNLYI